jgi:signal peptidase I
MTQIRRPWLAAVLTLVQPGLGHLYAGRLQRGIVVFAILAVLGVVAIVLTLLRPGVVSPIAAVLLLLAFVIAVVDAWIVAKRARPFQLHAYNRWYVYLGVLACGWVLGRFRADILQAFRIPSAAMAPTLMPHDWIYVDKRSATRRTLARQDLLVYRSPDDRATVIKRIVGVPGDTLLMRNDTLMRNGSRVAESYVDWLRIAADRAGTSELGNWGPVVVPPNTVFVLGDNRHESKDSRQVGPIPAVSAIGKPLVIYYSYDAEGDTPLPFLTAIRWQRVGKRVM